MADAVHAITREHGRRQFRSPVHGGALSGKITTDSLIGAWRLQRAIQVFDDGQVLDEFGAHSDGYLCYTPDGTVSAVLGSSDRPPLDAPDPQAATADEYASAAQRFIAYAGRFTIESEDGLVTHHIDVSLFSELGGAGSATPANDGRRPPCHRCVRAHRSRRTSFSRRASLESPQLTALVGLR